MPLRRPRTRQPSDREQAITLALAAIAQEKGVSQSELFRRTGVSQPLLSQVFAGQRSLILSEFDALCAALGVSMSEVLERAGLR